MRPALSTKRTLVATALLGTLLAGGCGSGDGSDDGGETAARPASGAEAERRNAPAEDDAAYGSLTKELGDVDSGLRSSAGSDLAQDGTVHATTADAPREQSSAGDLLEGQAVISKAVVSVQSEDVQQARFDALKVMDKYGGTLAADETTSGDDGELQTARLIMRIPTKDYARAKIELEKVADFVQSHSGSEDVTTEVIDVQARIRAQEQSLARVEALLAQARRLRTVIAIESQLTRRQAELDSLKSRQAFLADQTSDATITMHIERTPEEKQKKEEEKDDDKGFLAGLNDGWDALVAATVGIATVIGVLLPFALVLVLIGVPLLVLTRRLRPLAAREPATEASE